MWEWVRRSRRRTSWTGWRWSHSRWSGYPSCTAWPPPRPPNTKPNATFAKNSPSSDLGEQHNFLQSSSIGPKHKSKVGIFLANRSQSTLGQHLRPAFWIPSTAAWNQESQGAPIWEVWLWFCLGLLDHSPGSAARPLSSKGKWLPNTWQDIESYAFGHDVTWLHFAWRDS